jgi:hypothetical protein
LYSLSVQHKTWIYSFIQYLIWIGLSLIHYWSCVSLFQFHILCVMFRKCGTDFLL